MKSKKITFCGAMAALATVLMLSAYFPYVTYAVPCMASLPIMAVVIELDKRFAFLTYLASILPIMLFCETESKVIYLCFTGFYPILKSVLEKIKNRGFEYILKFICLNLSVILIYLISSFVFGISFEDLGELGKYGTPVFLVLVNCVFILLDFCLSKMAIYYILRLSKVVNKFIKFK